jgi:hypothetical protein
MKNLSFLILCLTMVAASAEAPTKKLQPTTPMPKSSLSPELEPPIRKGAMIAVDSYNAKSKTYNVTIVNEAGAGPNVAMPIDLAKATGSVDEKEIISRPEMVVGNSYELKSELRLLSEAGVKIRTQLVNSEKK